MGAGRGGAGATSGPAEGACDTFHTAAPVGDRVRGHTWAVQLCSGSTMVALWPLPSLACPSYSPRALASRPGHSRLVPR